MRQLLQWCKRGDHASCRRVVRPAVDMVVFCACREPSCRCYKMATMRIETVNLLESIDNDI